jgi:hypothetical protein
MSKKDIVATEAWLAELSSITDPLAVKVLVLHKRHQEYGLSWGECNGCEFDGYECEGPEWPCATVRLVAEHFGHPAPKWVEFAAPLTA